MSRLPSVRALLCQRLFAPFGVFMLALGLSVHASGQSLAALGPLDQLMQEAMSSHPAVVSKLANQKAAGSEVDAARLQFWPTPSVTNEVYQGRNIATVRLQQPLWTAGYLTGGLDQARAQQAVADWSLQETRQAIAERVISAYAEWYRSHHRLVAAQSGVQSHEELYGQITARVAAGLSPESDQRLAQARLIQAQSDLLAAKSAERGALAQLQQLLGRSADSAALARSIEPVPALPPLATLLDQALANSPTLRRAREEVAAVEAETRVRDASAYPQAFVRAERQLGSYTDAGAAPVNRLVFGFQVTPGAGLSSIKQRDAVVARLEAARSTLDAQRRDLAERVNLTYVDYESARERSAGNEQALLANQGVLESYRRQFLVGKKTWIDLMNAVREVSQTQVAQADIQTSMLSAGRRLMLYTSDLFSPAASDAGIAAK